MAEKLVEISRGDVVECIHRGDVAIVDASGNLLYSAGDPYKYTYMRSAAKPFQALTIILSGAYDHFELDHAELAIACGSHYAEKFHLKTLERFLKKLGLQKDHIKGGIVNSLNSEYALRLAWQHEKLTPLHSDCSGKHAGMLSVCRKKKYDLGSYLSPGHPLQQEILQLIANICDYEKDKIAIGIDGCSAPVHALPLYNMALGYARLSSGTGLDLPMQKASHLIFEAMNDKPEMISGTGGFCTELIRNTHRKLIGKIGAEGVYGIGLKKEAIGIAIKIESGNMEATQPVALEILNQLDLLDKREKEALHKFHLLDNLNDLKVKAGAKYPVFTLKAEK